MMSRKVHYVHGTDDMPKGPHLSVFTFGTHHIPAGGHGWPASTESTTEFRWWHPEDEQEWLAEVESLMKDKRRFVAMKGGVPVKFELKVSLAQG